MNTKDTTPDEVIEIDEHVSEFYADLKKLDKKSALEALQKFAEELYCDGLSDGFNDGFDEGYAACAKDEEALEPSDEPTPESSENN